MSGTAPTPGLFGRDEAAAAANPRSEDQMAPADARSWWPQRATEQGAVGSYAEGWWQNAPVRTTLATTTGQNTSGVNNAFDTDWWESVNRQEREQTTQLGRWSRTDADGNPDADGIATYSFGQDEAARPGLEGEVVKFGDVFSSGRKVGNIYEGYGGMTAADADEIMARLILPREVWAAAYETEAGTPLMFTGSLSDEIRRAAAQRTEDFTKGLTAAAFEGEVADTAAGMETSGAAQAGNIAAGAAAGAAWGAGLGSIVPVLGTGVGAAVGAVLGGFGAWVNRDEQFRMYAQALEQFEQARDGGFGGVGLADAASGFTGAFAASMNVSRNLLHGAYDAAAGEIGDQSSAYQDTEVPLWMQGADFAALLVDGVGSFGSSISRRVYMRSMGLTTTAEVASIGLGAAEGGMGFNPYSGSYEQLSGWGQTQRGASAAIDAAQTVAVGRLGAIINRVGGRSGAISRGGHVITTEGGVQSARLGFSSLIPSEAATGISARMWARAAVRNQGIPATRENLRIQTARQIEMLTTGRKTIATAVVNGFGEGGEEVVQAVLGATAFGETPTFQEIVNAAKQGFAMGAGMGVAIGRSEPNRSQVYLDKANAVRAFQGQQEWSKEEWDKLTDSEQAMQGTQLPTDVETAFTEAAATAIKMAAPVAAANFVEIRRMNEVALQDAERSAEHSQRSVETSKLTLQSNYDWGPQDYVVSVTAALRDAKIRRDLLLRVSKGEQLSSKQDLTITPEQREMATQILATDTQLVDALEKLSATVEALRATGLPEDLARINEAISKFNGRLRAMWYAKDADENGLADPNAFGARRTASVWGSRFPLNSAGSFQLLRLQLSADLTIRGTNNSAMVPDAIQEAIAGDYDGDRFVNMLRQLLPEETFLELKQGAGLLTADGVMVRAKPYTELYLQAMSDALVDPGSSAHAAAEVALRNMRSKLFAELSKSEIPEIEWRRLVRDLSDGLKSNQPEQIGAFFDELSRQFAPGMRTLGDQLGDSPYLQMNRIIETELREFQDKLALRDGARLVAAQLDLAKPSKNMPKRAPRRVRGASQMFDAAMQGLRYNMFRLEQVLKYSAYREPIQTDPAQSADVMAEFYRIFTARNDGMVRPGEQNLFETTIAQERTINWLEQIAEDYRQDFQGLTKYEAMVLLAGTEVDDMDANHRDKPRSDDNIRLIQGLLREVVVQLRSEYVEIMGDPAVAQRMNSLDALTNPSYMKGDKESAQGGEAFVEVLGAFPLSLLLGEQAGAIQAGMTVRSLRDHIRDMRWDAREAYVESLKQHDAYKNIEGRATTAYRVLVDMVVESARMQLSEDRTTGVVSGLVARPSRVASDDFKTMHDSTRAIARSRGSQPTAAKLRTMLENDPRLAEPLLRMIEARGIKAAAVQYTQNGELGKVRFPTEIYEILAEGKTKRAEQMLLDMTLEFAKVGLQTLDDDGNPMDQLDPHRVNDKILRLWLDLEYRASSNNSDSVHAQVTLQDFHHLRKTSPSTDAFIGALNTDWRFREARSAPYIAWVRDRSLVTADRFGRGISEVQEGVEMRDALREAARVAAAVLHNEEDLKSYSHDNAELTANLQKSLKASKSGRGNDELWNRFKGWFDIVKDVPTMVAASVWIQQAGHINEILSNMGVKGISPENVEALGKAIAAQLPTFDAAAGRLVSSLTSGSMYEVIMDMSSLARDSRTILLDDGTVVDWTTLDAEGALALLSNPRTAGLASRMLGMTAWDYNSDLNQNVLVSGLGRGIAGFTANVESSLWGTDTVSQFRRMMVLESMSTPPGGTPIVPVLLAQWVNMAETGSDHVISDVQGPNGTERERIAVEGLSLIANAFDKLSRITTPAEAGALMQVEDDRTPEAGQWPGTGQMVSIINRTLLRAGRKARIAKGVGNQVGKMLPAQPGPVRDAMYDRLARRQWLLEIAGTQTDSQILKLKSAQLKTDLENSTSYVSPLDVLLDTYSDYTDPTTQALLTAYATQYGDLAIAAPWARTAVLRLMGEKPMSDEDWHWVARAVIAHTLHANYGLAARSETRIAMFPSLKDMDQLEAQRSAWDPTFVEIGLDFFAPNVMNNPQAEPGPILASSLELYRTLAPTLTDVSADQAEAAVMALIAPQISDANGNKHGVTGDWHALFPALLQAATGAAVASSAASAISMAGINPERLRLLLARTRQDWSRRPADTELSTAMLDAAQLIAARSQDVMLTSMVSMQIAGRPDPVDRPLVQLEGRVVRELSLTLPGQEPVSLLNHSRWSTGLLLPTETGAARGEAGVVNLDTLAQSVETYLNEAGVPLAQRSAVTISISFFHPETKSISATRGAGSNYDHNAWFDGVSAATDAAFTQRSQLGSFYFGLAGKIPGAYATAMAATKELKSALQQVSTMPERQRAIFTAGGTTDMAGMLRAMTDFAIRQPIDGRPQSIRDYGSYYKLLTLLYVVRFVDATGVHVLSAEEVIARQMRGEVFTPENHAQTIGLPLHFVLALMGEHNLAAYGMAIAPRDERMFSANIAPVAPYLQFPAAAWTDRMFGGLARFDANEDGSFRAWSTRPLLEEPALLNLTLPRGTAYSRNGVSRKDRSDYWGPLRKDQKKKYADRANSGKRQTFWPEQGERVRSMVTNPNIMQEALQAAQLVAEGRHGEAAMLTSRRRNSVAPTNDYRTGWLYIHEGERVGGAVHGILSSPTEIEENATVDDFVILPVSGFYKEGQQIPELSEVLPKAQAVIRMLRNMGATIEIPADTMYGGALRSAMLQYARENDYVEEGFSTGRFLPQAHVNETQAKAAFASTLSAPRPGSSTNRVLVDASVHNTFDEGGAGEVNGGLGQLESIYVRETVQTARFAGYGPLILTDRNERAETITLLLQVLKSRPGIKYLLRQSDIKPQDTEALAEFNDEIAGLIKRLDMALVNTDLDLLPVENDPDFGFGTGFFIPLGSYNEDGELIGVHLARHGHVPVDEQVLFGAELPEGNEALGVNGVRLTIDKGKVDALQTTHRGVMVWRKWLGRQGFVAMLQVAIDSLGAKVTQIGAAMKMTITSTPSRTLVPSVKIFANKPVLLVTDLATKDAKGSDEDLNVASRIIEAVGFNIMPFLVRRIYDLTLDATNRAEYDAAALKLHEALVRYATLHSGDTKAEEVILRHTSGHEAALRGEINKEFNKALEDASIDLDDLSTTQRIADNKMIEMALAALSVGANVDEIISAPGYIGMPTGSESHTMHPVFTTLLDRLPWEHPARLAFVEQVNARMMPPGQSEGYQLDKSFLTWIRHVVDKNGVLGEKGLRYEIPAMLSYKEIRLTDTNDTLSEQAQARRNKGSVSPTTQAMVMTAAGAAPMLDRPLRTGGDVFARNEILHTGLAGQKALAYGSQAQAKPFTPRMDDDLRPTRGEQRHINLRAIPSRKALAREIDTAAWFTGISRAKAIYNRGLYLERFGKALIDLKLNGDKDALTELLRAVTARPAPEEGEPEHMTYTDAMAGLRLLLTNAEQHNLPTHGAPVNATPRWILHKMKSNGYILWAGNGSKKPLSTWNEWVEALISDVFTDDPTMRRYVAVTNILDGIMYEYRKDVKGLPATFNERLKGIFSLARTPTGLFISSPNIRTELLHPVIQRGEDLLDTTDLTSADWMVEELPQEARAIVEERMTAWEAKQGIRRKRQSPLSEARRGIHLRESLSRTNVILRYITLGYVMKTLVNPGLFVSAFIELAIKGGQENAVSFLAGENLGAQGFTPAQRKMWENTVTALANSEKFYALVYRNTNYQQVRGASSRIEKGIEHLVNRTAGAFNDPTWLVTSPLLARTFLEAAWYTAGRHSDDRFIPVEQFLETAGIDIESLATIDPMAVAAGFARIEYRRNLQDNLVARMVRQRTDAIIDSGSRVGNVLGTLLLRIPTMFLRFRSNTIINMFGLQGPHAALTMLMSERSKRPGGIKDYITGASDGMDHEVTAQARMEDSYDLTRAIIRSGVSHTQLMILGTMLSAAGFGGDDDDEQRLLNKLRRYQHEYVAKDPFAIENDFRNAQAWFNGFFPGGMAMPTWLIKPFVSPAMGIARFYETGDIRQIYYGFADALGDMPLLNADNILNSWTIANELTAAAEAEALSENVESTARASRLMWTAVGTLEAMLFESAFASAIYQAQDEFDRDPFKIPLVDSSGVVQTDALGQPRPTNALDDFIDPETGEARQGYLNRTDTDAFLHSLGENRPLFAWLASKIMDDSSFIRNNMVPKTREVDSQELTQEEAAQIVMSVYSNELGETLTTNGAAGVIRGIHLGTIALDSPALNGIFIPEEMRMDLQDMFLEQLTQKYLDLGYSKSEALDHAGVEYYGQAYGDPEGLGLADIIWASEIPKYQTQRYYQLNTTYVMGPNNQPIATGLQRSILSSFGMNLPGLGFFETYHAGTTGNLEIDDLLNSVDTVRGVNLGQRALLKVGENWLPPTQEEIADQIEAALDRIGKKIDDTNDILGRGYGYGGGYGGGSGGYTSRADYGGMAQRLNTPRTIDTPYALSPRVVNTSNPTLRRATIRRERISSERGRLNQWQ